MVTKIRIFLKGRESLFLAAGISLLGCAGINDAPSSEKTVVITTLTTGHVFGNSIVVTPDGLPIISFYNSDLGGLQVLRCGTADCSSGNSLATVDIGGLNGVGTWNSIGISDDGVPIIAYSDRDRFDLKVVKCGNISCTDRNAVTLVDTAGLVGIGVTLVVPPDGLPIIVYGADSGRSLKVAKCGNAACTEGNVFTTVDTSYGETGDFPSLAVPDDGLPVICYHDYTQGALKLLKCGNASCTNGNSIVVLDTGGLYQPSLALLPGGIPIVSYRGLLRTPPGLKFAKCGDPACSTGNVLTELDNSGGVWTSVKVSPHGLPLISYQSSEHGGSLKFLSCGSDNCRSGNVITVLDMTVSGSRQETGAYNSLYIPPDGRPIISYVNSAGELSVAKCNNLLCNSSRN